jgi:aminopeptidase N
LQGARTFSWALLYGFRAFSTTVGDVEIYAYVFPLHSIAGQASLQTMANALPVFEQRFGAYPFETLTVVELEIEDGMEFDGIYLLGERWFATYYGDPKNYLTILSAHEAAHNWWFSQVGNDQALEPWLDEALTTYTELLFYEEMYPELVNWWWEYRVTLWEPVGNVDGSIYDYGYYEAYRQAVYLRGAQFFQALREAMGDEAFFAFLRDYAAQGRYRIMTSDDFFALVREHSDADFAPILAEYFATP